MLGQKITDGSNDKKYFFQTPHIVWARARTPYDFTLWNVVKMVAGEAGECFLSTPQLAILSMMSAGQVSDCRRFLLDVGLLAGELRQDLGYPQPVWHLQIPDLWKENLEWRQEHDSLLDRIEYKKSLHQVEPSPGEKGIIPGEKGITPGETKKNYKEEPKRKTNNGASAPPSSPLTRHLTALWKVKRLNSSQAAIITELEAIYPYEKVIEAATWAHTKSMAFGAALLSIKKALPNWGNNGKGGNSGKRRNGTNGRGIQNAPCQHQIADPASFDPIAPDGTAIASGG